MKKEKFSYEIRRETRRGAGDRFVTLSERVIKNWVEELVENGKAGDSFTVLKKGNEDAD